MKIVGLILIMVGCIMAMILGSVIGETIFGDGFVGRIIGVGIGFLMILGLVYIGQQTNILGE